LLFHLGRQNSTSCTGPYILRSIFISELVHSHQNVGGICCLNVQFGPIIFHAIVALFCYQLNRSTLTSELVQNAGNCNPIYTKSPTELHI
jgi:hypothetical protein